TRSPTDNSGSRARSPGGPAGYIQSCAPSLEKHQMVPRSVPTYTRPRASSSTQLEQFPSSSAVHLPAVDCSLPPSHRARALGASLGTRSGGNLAPRTMPPCPLLLKQRMGELPTVG